MRKVLVLSAMAFLIPIPSASASHQDQCAGGTDWSTGIFDWQSAWELNPPVTCSGVLGICCSFDDTDYYRVDVPVGTTAASISVRVCASVSDTFGTIDFALLYQDALQNQLGTYPTTLDEPPQLLNGQCFTSLRILTGTTLIGGAWYIRLFDALGVCCNPPTTYSYTLEVSASNS